MIDELINLDRYPLTDPAGAAWASVVADTRRQLAEDGCAVLHGFVRPNYRGQLQAEGARMAPDANYGVETVNAYNIDTTMPLSADHPGRMIMQRGNAFVARDQISATTIIQQIYGSTPFKRFLAECFSVTELHELGDPLSGLVLNVITNGKQHPWHFDTNEFTVSLLTQQAAAGGEFEYCPNIRSADDEHFDDVSAVLGGRGEPLIRRLRLRPGDLQLFKGRFSLHRVREVTGDTARHSAIFAYSERPGVIGSRSRTRQLFGRLAPAHDASVAGAAARTDQLLD